MKKIFAILFLIFTISLAFCDIPIVQDIQAQVSKGTKVNIFWTLPADCEISKIVLFRSTTPLTSYDHIKVLKPLTTLEGFVTGYTDSLKDYKDYYYAVICYVDNEPVDLLMAGVNSTVKGIHLDIPSQKPAVIDETEDKLYFTGELREIPLPYLESKTDDNNTNLSQNALDKAKTLMNASKTENKLLAQYIFEEDLVSPDAGDDFLLFDILKNYFVQKQYSSAIIQLEKLIATNINENTRNRAYFYLGESNYLMGNYINAIKTFAIVENIYPELTKRWVNSSLDQL